MSYVRHHERNPSFIGFGRLANETKQDDAGFRTYRTGPEISVAVPTSSGIGPVNLAFQAEEVHFRVVGQREVSEMHANGLGLGRGDLRRPHEPAILGLFDHAALESLSADDLDTRDGFDHADAKRGFSILRRLREKISVLLIQHDPNRRRFEVGGHLTHQQFVQLCLPIETFLAGDATYRSFRSDPNNRSIAGCALCFRGDRNRGEHDRQCSHQRSPGIHSSSIPHNSIPPNSHIVARATHPSHSTCDAVNPKTPEPNANDATQSRHRRACRTEKALSRASSLPDRGHSGRAFATRELRYTTYRRGGSRNVDLVLNLNRDRDLALARHCQPPQCYATPHHVQEKN